MEVYTWVVVSISQHHSLLQSLHFHKNILLPVLVDMGSKNLYDMELGTCDFCMIAIYYTFVHMVDNFHHNTFAYKDACCNFSSLYI